VAVRQLVELRPEDDGVLVAVGIEEPTRRVVVASADLSSDSTGVIPLPAPRATTSPVP